MIPGLCHWAFAKSFKIKSGFTCLTAKLPKDLAPLGIIKIDQRS